MTGTPDHRRRPATLVALARTTPSDLVPVQREALLLPVLALVAALVFGATRELARYERAASLADGAQWFEVGERQLREGQVDRAVESLRKAVTSDRGSRQYGLALARALAANGQGLEARRTLWGLRDAFPDDPGVHTDLARLAADRGDVTEAQRFYQNALYGVWPDGREDDRRRLRLELIELLLRHGHRDRALAEVVALSTNLPDAPAARIEAGQLFLAAGDPDLALDQFTRALRLAPRDDDALAGAGEAAFARGEYAAANRHLSSASRLPDRLVRVREVARLVLATDPLEVRLTLAARRDRLRVAVAQAGQRLEQCAAARPGSGPALDPLRAELAAFVPKLESRTLRDQPELVDAGVGLVYRVALATAESCGEPEGLDRALLLIGARHQREP